MDLSCAVTNLRPADFDPVLKPHERLHLDEGPDALFYQVPRVGVHHVDESWRKQLTGKDDWPGIGLAGLDRARVPRLRLIMRQSKRSRRLSVSRKDFTGSVCWQSQEK